MVVRTERISTDQAVVEVIAAVEAKADAGRAYSPFGRFDARTTTITEADFDRMTGMPAPLHIPIPVVVHE